MLLNTKMMRISLSLFSFFFLFVYNASAQESIVVSGGNEANISGSVSYSIGQTVVETKTDSSGSITEGVQQPYEILTLSISDSTYVMKLECRAYPNPTKDLLVLDIDNISAKGFTYEVYDLSGRLISKRDITTNQTDIKAIGWVPAVYLLKVIKAGKEIQTFKIIKN